MLTPKIVEGYLPDALQEGVIYVSLRFATVSHLCACGCGIEVVTPLSPTEWKMTLIEGRVTLHPSIGNWSFPCRSHYWVKNNQVVWASDAS